MQNLIEYWRQLSVEALFETKTFNDAFEQWKKNGYINFKAINDVFSFGTQMSSVFLSTGKSGREQGELSAGGNVWECFITWYLNLLTVGSNVLFIKHKKDLIPSCVSNAITVNYGSVQSNTESDILAIKFCNDSNTQNRSVINDLLSKDKQDFSFVHNNENIALVKVKSKSSSNQDKYNNFSEVIDLLTQKCFEDVVLNIIQCKTNWNDNAQIPMLWDIVYSSKGFKNHRISLGKNGWNIDSLKNFYYSFVTVPSNQNVTYKTDSVAVKRVANLSGGNYWGKKTDQSIARCINELPNAVFGMSIMSNLKSHLTLPITSDYSYFRL